MPSSVLCMVWLWNVYVIKLFCLQKGHKFTNLFSYTLTFIDGDITLRLAPLVTPALLRQLRLRRVLDAVLREQRPVRRELAAVDGSLEGSSHDLCLLPFDPSLELVQLLRNPRLFHRFHFLRWGGGTGRWPIS